MVDNGGMKQFVQSVSMSIPIDSSHILVRLFLSGSALAYVARSKHGRKEDDLLSIYLTTP